MTESKSARMCGKIKGNTWEIKKEMVRKYCAGEITMEEYEAWRHEWNKEERRDQTMCNGQTLLDMARIVENATTIRIDINGEEMQLTPHRLALYSNYRVKKMFVNIQAELEMELED